MSLAFVSLTGLPLANRCFSTTRSSSYHHSSILKMSTMLALHQHSYARDAITLGPLPIPAPPPSHVLLRVHAAALNPIDLKRTRAEDFPIIMGYDVAGEIHAVAEDITEWKVGDRVFGDVMSNSTGPKVTGSIAQFCVCPADMLARVPDNIKMIEAAALPVAAQTAIQALELAECRSEDRVFISGGAGGVGVHAIQISKAMFGASEVGTTASAGKLDFVRRYGADKVVDYRRENAGEVLAKWADVVVDCTRETDMGKKILKPGGRIVSIAEFSKADVLCFSLKPSKEMIERVATMLADGSLRAVIDSVYPLSHWETAIQHLADGHARGKIVLQVA